MPSEDPDFYELSFMLSEGRAARVAEMMEKAGRVFPAFLDALTNDEWPVRLGAMFMDMGTGKTRTALELALRRIGEGKADTILWLCPVGVRSTIAAEVAKELEGSK